VFSSYVKGILQTLLLLTVALRVTAQEVPAPAQPVGEPVAPAPSGPEAPPAKELQPKTVSESRQFVVHGSDFVMRSAIASLAEEIRGALLETVGKEDDWEHSIAIQLHGNQGDKAPARTMRTKFFKVPGGFRLQLDIHLAKGKPSGLDGALLELLLLEWGLRGQDDLPIDTALGIPHWLTEGLLESFRWRRGDRDRTLYAALFNKSQLFPVKNILEVEDLEGMDTMTNTAFCVSSGALVMALLNQEGGKQSLAATLGEIATFEGDEMSLLMKHFPGMNLGKESFSKWWALQLAKLSEVPFTQVLTIRETEEQLKTLLLVRFKGPAGNEIEVGTDQFRDLLALPLELRRAAIKPVGERSGLFLYRAFPAHRPIFTEYLTILAELAYDKDQSVEERLEGLAMRRSDLLALGLRTRDYLDWVLITKSNELSGDFESFIELKENLQAKPSKHRGHVSEYLDSMQRVFED